MTNPTKCWETFSLLLALCSMFDEFHKIRFHKEKHRRKLEIELVQSKVQMKKRCSPHWLLHRYFVDKVENIDANRNLSMKYHDDVNKVHRTHHEEMPWTSKDKNKTLNKIISIFTVKIPSRRSLWMYKTGWLGDRHCERVNAAGIRWIKPAKRFDATFKPFRSFLHSTIPVSTSRVQA